MARVLFDGQIFSIHNRGGIARLFYSVYQESKRLPLSRNSGPYLARGLIFSMYAEDENQGKWNLPFVLRGRGMSKLSLVVNWVYLWLAPYRILHSTYYFHHYLRRRPGTKHVVTLHDMIPEDFPEYFPNGNPHFQKEAFLRDADRIVCVSNFTLSRLKHHYPELAHKAKVISSGVTIQNFEEGIIERNSTILYVGSRNGYKDFPTLMRALPEVLELDPNIQILAVGDQQFSDGENSLISELGLKHKVFQKELSDAELHKAYRTCFLTVVTSHVEGFGLPVIEAMSHQALVVATDIPVFREISGNSFVSFTPGNSKDLASKIKSILNEPQNYKELAEKGLQVAQLYSWNNVLTSLYKLYEEI